MAPGPEKRIPGQSNADYERRSDPVGAHLAQHDVHRGHDLTWVLRAYQGLGRLLGRAFGRRPASGAGDRSRSPAHGQQ